MVVVIIIVSSTVGFQFCSKKDTAVTTPDPINTTVQPVLPASPYNYANVAFPAHIMAALVSNDNTPAGNAITDDGATLGRVLFYDKHLSKNTTVSCASCHNQQFSFIDTAKLSKGFESGLTARHSMPLLNVRFYGSGKMFWDERAATLEKQVLQPIQNHVEMGLTLSELETNVSALNYYPALFLKAFGSTQIDSVKIARALSQFVRSIVTYQSKYDKVKQGTASFTADEAAGEQLFLTAGVHTCAGCHTPPMFLTSQPALGFALLDPTDHGINNENRFKAGSLRNIGSRVNLFHNGSIRNLQAMLGTPGNPPIPDHTVAPPDVQKILAFLQTLNDPAVITDPKFSNPFN